MKNCKLNLAKLALCFALVLSLCGSVVTVLGSSKTAKAADTADYTNYLGLEDRTSWASGGHADIVTLGLMDFSITEGNQYFKSSVSDCWYHGNSTIIEKNNGVDILQYIYLNDSCARDLIVANSEEGKTTANTGYWLSNPAAWPIAFETGTDCWIRIDKTAFNGSFTFTIKAGFSLIRNDGVVCTTSKDIVYKYENSVLTKLYTLSFQCEGATVDAIKVTNGLAITNLPAVPAKEGHVGFWSIDGAKLSSATVYNYGADKTAVAEYVQATDITARLGMEDRAWGAQPDEVYVALLDMGVNNGTEESPNYWFNTHADVSTVWNVDDPAYAQKTIPNNFGINIMDYILINGESASSLVRKNLNGELDKVYVGSTGWTGRNDCCPVFVESTTGSGFIIKLIKEYSTTSFTLTIKAGFTIINLAGEVVTVSRDVDFVYNSGSIVKEIKYQVSFESEEEIAPITVVGGSAMANLPEVPAKEGYVAYWAIDGVKVTSATVYEYGADKTAVANYKKIVDITDRIDMEDRSWGAHDGEVYVGLLDMGKTYMSTDGNENHYLNTSVMGTWHRDNADVIAFNDGIDIMEYIHVNGVSARSLITANVDGKNSCSCWLSNPAAYPVYVETTADGGIMMRLATAEFGNEITITIKAGFAITNIDGEVATVSKDVEFKYVDASVGRVYVLSFESSEAEVEPIAVINRKAMANLPEVPAKDGYRGVWTIDGIEVTADTVYSFNANKTAVAVYTLVHTVTFDGENAIVVDDGAKLERPADPSKEATVSAVYTFDAWYNGDVAWDFEVDVVTEDINLVAKFTETVRTYTVSFAVSGREDVVLEDKTAEYGATVDLSTLLDGVDLEGYTVAITVDGEEVTSIDVVSDVVVNVEFTADKVDESVEESEKESTVESKEESTVESTESVKESVEEPAKKGGCGGSAVGTAMFSVLSLLAVAILRKKSDR